MTRYTAPNGYSLLNGSSKYHITKTNKKQGLCDRAPVFGARSILYKSAPADKVCRYCLAAIERMTAPENCYTGRQAVEMLEARGVHYSNHYDLNKVAVKWKVLSPDDKMAGGYVWRDETIDKFVEVHAVRSKPKPKPSQHIVIERKRPSEDTRRRQLGQALKALGYKPTP